MADAPRPDSKLVPVFRTTERGLVPLATLALDEAGIAHVVQHPHMADIIVGGRSELASPGPADQSAIAVLVAVEDQDRARAVLADLAQSSAGMPERGAAATMPPGEADAGAEAVPADSAVDEPGAVVTDARTGAVVAHLTDNQLAWLGGRLELESSTDTDYYLDRATLEMLEQAGGDPALLTALRAALGGREGLDVRWSRRFK